MSQVQIEFVKFGFGLLLSLMTLAFGWLIGQRLTVNWNLRQKRRELDFLAVSQFHSIYGEQKEISRIWRLVKKQRGAPLEPPADIRWQLATRACQLESRYESLVVKLATERPLCDNEISQVGLFRQAVQQVRESIRDDVEIPASSFGTDYVFVNALAADVARVVASGDSSESISPRQASDNLFKITFIGREDFATALNHFKAEHPNVG